MHYKVNQSLIKSELAAKPPAQTNKYVIKWINSLNHNNIVLDYGCGKLRYSIPLSKALKKVYIYDSDIQINRKQVINGNKVKIRKLVENEYANMFIIDEITNNNYYKMFDYVLCSNVLSAIPFSNIRINILKKIKRLLKKDGELFINVKYRYSYFKNYPNSYKYNDGYIRDYKNVSYFYGIIKPNKLERILKNVGFKIFKKIKKNGSIFINCS